MSYVPYKSSDTWWFWRPEYQFRKGKNGDSTDAANGADDTFYPLPVRLTNENQVYVRKKIRWSKYYTQSRFQQIQNIGYEDIEIELSGPVVDRSWFGYLTDQISNSGSEAPYTHTSVSTSAITNPPRTIQLLRITKNDYSGGSQNEVKLYTGCIVKDYKESATANEEITGSWTIHATNEVSGVDLNTYPAQKTEVFVFHSATLTYTKSTTEYQGVLTGYEFSYETDKKLTRGGTSLYAIAPQSPNEVKAEIVLTMQVWDKARLEACEDSVESAQSKTIKLKTQRSASDYFEIEFAKAFTILEEDPAFENGVLVAKITAAHNLKESGAALTLTEVNDYDSTRY